MTTICRIVASGKQIRDAFGFSISLTARQQDVLALLCEGMSNKVISRRLGLANATVKCHVASILRSLNVDSRLRAVSMAFQLGLVSPEPAGSDSEREAPRSPSRPRAESRFDVALTH